MLATARPILLQQPQPAPAEVPPAGANGEGLEEGGASKE